jgi:23S rRNA (guanine745-N1)-methyltransferase
MMPGSMENSDPCTALLACPVCGGTLADAGGDDSRHGDARRGGSARCAQGHSFDYARSGYLNLTGTGGGGRVGDTAEMVRARAEFLATGHYRRVAEAVAGVAAEAVANPGAEVAADAERKSEARKAGPSLVAEIGCGTAYYLDAVVRALADSGPRPECAFGFDLSKAAVTQAAREHPDLHLAVADVEDGIPLRDSTADLVLSAFAPRPGPELARIVKPGGSLVVAFAGPQHLESLRERLNLLGVGEDKLDRLSERLDPWFDLIGTTTVQHEANFSPEEARLLVLMGPNAWHDSDPSSLDGGLADLVSVVVARFRRTRSRFSASAQSRTRRAAAP